MPAQKTLQETQQETQPATRHEAHGPLAQRLLWFVVLWLGGVGTVAVVAFGLRLWLSPK
jgi:hypothetical protein